MYLLQTYKSGLLEGEFIRYFPNGQLHKKLNYKKDLLDGECIEYNERGEKSLHGIYKMGKLEIDLLKNN